MLVGHWEELVQVVPHCGTGLAVGVALGVAVGVTVKLNDNEHAGTTACGEPCGTVGATGWVVRSLLAVSKATPASTMDAMPISTNPQFFLIIFIGQYHRFKVA